jgi:8-oxo-dGTP diphosphatase
VNQVYHCGVQCIVLRRRRVLLGKRFKTSCEGEWALPGGHVEFSESPLAAARRELKEETGLVGIEAVTGASFTTYTTELPYVHVPVFFRDTSGKPVVPPNEKFSDLGFFDLASLPSPLFAPSVTALELVGSGLTAHDWSVPGSSSYLRMDFVETTAIANTNRGYSVLLIRDPHQSWLVRSWGRRDQSGWRSSREEVRELNSGLNRVNYVVREKLKQGFVVTGVHGDISLTRLSSLFWGEAELQVVSRSFIESLLVDGNFRQGYVRDVNRDQLSLFDTLDLNGSGEVSEIRPD